MQDKPFLRFSPHKEHMERTPRVFSPASEIGKHSLNNQSQTEKPQTKSKSRDGINPDSKFKSSGAAGADSWLSASQRLDAPFHPWNHMKYYGWLPAVLLSDYAFYLKLFFLSTNQVFHQVACLFGFEAFNLTCQCQPEASSWSHIQTWLWLNSLIILRAIGTRCYQRHHSVVYLLNYNPAMVREIAYHLPPTLLHLLE